MIGLSNVEKQIESDEASVPNLRQNIGKKTFTTILFATSSITGLSSTQVAENP